MQMAINDEVIWAKHVTDKELHQRILAMREGETMDLEVDGVAGTWERMKDGKDGRPTLGIKPIGPMRDVWKTWRVHRTNQKVLVRLTTSASAYLSALSEMFPEWNSAEDELAFRDL
jgi:hypothetical protein